MKLIEFINFLPNVKCPDTASENLANPTPSEASTLSGTACSIPEDFGIPLDLVVDDLHPFDVVKLSTIGAMFIDYGGPNWQDKLVEWLKDAQTKGRLTEKEEEGVAYTTYRPFQNSSNDDRNLSIPETV